MHLKRGMQRGKGTGKGNMKTKNHHADRLFKVINFRINLLPWQAAVS